ncbi:hypothetical protein bcgnr5390_11130 [Bacillus luti]|nr:hypothetical protein BC2903_29780 [Bacillus cereus]
MLRKLDTSDFDELREGWENEAWNLKIGQIVRLAKEHGITVEETIACLEYEMSKNNMNMLNVQLAGVIEALDDLAGAFGGLDAIATSLEALDGISKALRRKGE